MKTLKKLTTVGFMIIVGLLVLSGVPLQEVQAAPKSKTSDVNVVNDAANPVPVADTDRVLPSQIVTLTSFTGATTSCPSGAGKVFREVTPNVTNIAFSVPAGQVLVVSSAELFMGPQAIALGKHLLWSLVRDNGSSSAGAFSSSVFTGPIGGSGSRSVTFPPGFVVPSGVTLCFFPPGVGSAAVFVYGHLAPDM